MDPSLVLEQKLGPLMWLIVHWGLQLLKVLEHPQALDGMRGSSSAMVFGPLGLQQT